MIGLTWASVVVPFVEQRMIIEGELIQIASEKCATSFNHSSFMASMIDL
jgi:hypothetical protein